LGAPNESKTSEGLLQMTIFIPTPLRQFAAGKDSVEVSAGTVAAALDELTRTHPDLRRHLFTGEGKVRAFVNVYLNDEDVRYLPEKDATKVSGGDTLSIIPSIAGGRQPAAGNAALKIRSPQEGNAWL
jgi:sulfur-carrier protein